MDNAYVDQRVEYFKKNRDVVQEILEKLGQRLPALFELNAGSLYKYLIVISIEKMISFAETEDLKKFLDLSTVTLFISKLIKCNDIMIITIALLTLERVITKIPEAYVALAREGVIEYVKSLSLTEEYIKLEAYPLNNKKYTNPWENYRNFSNTFQKLGNTRDIITEERERLEALMQQLRASEQAIENSSKAFKTLSTSLQTNKIPEEGMKNSYQNVPKSESLESKSITSLNNKQPLDMNDMDYEDEEDEEIALEKSPTIISQLQQEANMFQQQFQQSQGIKEQAQPVDKLMELRKEVSAFAIELYAKITEIVEKSKLSQKVPNSIIEKLEEISSGLDKGQLIPTEFGQRFFEEYINLINEHGRVTSYEISTSRILTNLLNFLSDNVIHPSKENKEETSGTKSSGTKMKEEERKSPTGDKKANDFKLEGNGDKPKLEINDFQCRIIVGRLISFLYYFRKSKSRDSKNLFLQDFLKNLQEMISNSDSLSGFVSRALTDYESSLSSDLRFLSQRIKFKAQFLGSADPFASSQTPDKKSKMGPTSLIKQKSTKAEDEKVMFAGASDSQTELFSYKEAVFKEIPLLALSVEQFGTLEVIEDYLLNKLNCKEDISGGMYGRNINDFLKDKFEAAASQDIGSDEEALQTEQQDQDNSGKKGSANKIPVTNPKTKSPGNTTTLKKSLSVNKGSTEPRFYKNEKKRLIDRHSGKEVNFRKYLEIKFYYKGEEVDKSRTIYELLQKFKKQNIYAGGDDFTIEYKLTIKPNDFSSSFSSAKDVKLNSLILSYKAYLQAIFGPISALTNKIEDQTLRETVQMMMLIKELVGFDKRVLCPWTLFNPVIIDLKVKYNLGALIDAYEKDLLSFRLEDVINKVDFVSERLSNIISKHVSDPLNLSSGQIPEILKLLCEHAPFLLNYNIKSQYYKMTGFHISRALYYIFQANKGKLKELESLRIGKLSKKKLRVSRDKILENAVVNMETYGYKKAVLEFEFNDEEGTGLGPTLEYFAMVTNEMKNPTHQLWRQTDSNLLYPTPIDPHDLKAGDSSKKSKTTTENKRDFEKFQLIFRCIGTLVGRSIIDERIVDMSLEPIFWNILLDKPIFLEDIAKIDKSLGATLMGLQEIVNKKQEIEKDEKLQPNQKSTKIRGLTFKNATIEDLSLNFVFPGYNDISLIENGEDMPVTLSNLDQYISILASYFLNETLRAQLVAFREGFDKVSPMKNLNIFEAEEIDFLICGGNRDEDWDLKTLEENFVASYGYTPNSQSYKNFIKVVSSFNTEEKKLFLKFVTGAERLPYGGFKSLNPKLTVVKRQPNHSYQSPDEYLPSVMTCQNYVKMPDYSSIQTMEKRLKFAMKEGQNSFSLS